MGKKELHGDIQMKTSIRRRFFEQFYDIIAQSVFQCLFYAYPKSRGQTVNNDMKRKLLNTFSKMFTGMKIQSASFDHWYNVLGQGNMLQNNQLGSGQNKKAENKHDLTLIDLNDEENGKKSQ